MIPSKKLSGKGDADESVDAAESQLLSPKVFVSNYWEGEKLLRKDFHSAFQKEAFWLEALSNAEDLWQLTPQAVGGWPTTQSFCGICLPNLGYSGVSLIKIYDSHQKPCLDSSSNTPPATTVFLIENKTKSRKPSVQESVAAKCSFCLFSWMLLPGDLRKTTSHHYHGRGWQGKGLSRSAILRVDHRKYLISQEEERILYALLNPFKNSIRSRINQTNKQNPPIIVVPAR